MRPVHPGTDRWHADLVLDRPGHVDVHRRGVERPASTWHHAVTVKIEAGQGAEDLANDLETGARLFDQLATSLAQARAAAGVAAAAKALRDTDARPRPPGRARRSTRTCRRWPTSTRSASWSPGRPRYSLWVDRPRALYGSWYEFFPRSIGAELASDPHAPAKPARHGTLQGRDRAPGLRRRAGLRRRLPAADPPDRQGEPQGPEQHAGGRDLGRRLARGRSARTTAATTRSIPSSARWPTSRPSCARARELGMEVALDFALQCAPDHPWVTDAPGVVHHQARRHHRLRREPAEEVPGHLPAQLRQRPEGPLRRMPAGAAALDRRRGADLPGRQPAHQADQLLALADRRGQAGPTRTCCSWPRRSPGRR